VNKSDDPSEIVVAAYASTGFIVAAALITAALIISADIRARSGMTAATSAEETDSKGGTAESSDETARTGLASAWGKALARLEDVKAQLPAGTGDRNKCSRLWLDAQASTGFTKKLEPASDLLDEHARLSAGQERVSELLKGLIEDRSSAAEVKKEIAALVDQMKETLNGLE
jgi:hypothetical protein